MGLLQGTAGTGSSAWSQDKAWPVPWWLQCATGPPARRPAGQRGRRARHQGQSLGESNGATCPMGQVFFSKDLPDADLRRSCPIAAHAPDPMPHTSCPIAAPHPPPHLGLPRPAVGYERRNRCRSARRHRRRSARRHMGQQPCLVLCAHGGQEAVHPWRARVHRICMAGPRLPEPGPSISVPPTMNCKEPFECSLPFETLKAFRVCLPL
jgi:hypothetical protein